jgi:hypothetical protein
MACPDGQRPQASLLATLAKIDKYSSGKHSKLTPDTCLAIATKIDLGGPNQHNLILNTENLEHLISLVFTCNRQYNSPKFCHPYCLQMSCYGASMGGVFGLRFCQHGGTPSAGLEINPTLVL